MLGAASACVSVGDREADVYDLFLEPRPRGVDLLVRAAWDRRVEHDETYLGASVAAAPQVGKLTLRIPRHGQQPARTATLDVRRTRRTLRPPKHRATEQLAAVTVWAVQATETAPPAGVKAVEWLLLTTCVVRDGAGALEVLEWYACRWGIEVWHKILTSGCRIEARQVETAARLMRCLTLYSVIAWRMLYATMLARAVPEASCEVLLEGGNGRRCGWRSTNGRHRQRCRRACARRCAGSGSWAASWGARATASRVRKCCGKAFSIWLTSPRCITSCVRPHRSEMWVMISRFQADGIAELLDPR